MIKVAGLWIYPIKSCQGISVSDIQITHLGPAFDRRWMIVDENNHYITLRTHAKLSQIITQIDENYLTIKFGHFEFKTELNQQNSKTETVTVQDKTLQAGFESDVINNALSFFLNQTVKLVKYQNESFRSIDDAATKSVIETTFTDVRPVLLTNVDSLTDLNEKLLNQQLQPSEMNRFRPNIIISGLEAYQEDHIQKITIGDVEFVNPKLCGRCVIVSMDSKSGQVVSSKTLKYLPLHQFPKGPKITFGLYLTPENLGIVQVGDVCRVIV